MISALAISYNEESNIEKFIESLSFADEIIIVDSNSTDKTVELAKSLGATVWLENLIISPTKKTLLCNKPNMIGLCFLI